MARHVPQFIAEVASTLSMRYHDDAHNNRRNSFEELLFILCSLQTNEELYSNTFALLKGAYRTFDDLAEADPDSMAKVLRGGGLHKQKANIISRIARLLRAEYGRVTLAPLRLVPTSKCEAFLTALPGVGKKTARCVMMYSLGRSVFPVDTHCWRICRRLGWASPPRPDKSCSPADMDRLQSHLPSEYRHSLHVNMISLGRDVCTARQPRCSACAIKEYCPRIGVSDSR